MGAVKHDCTFLPWPGPTKCLCSCCGDWEVHPSWKTAMDSLCQYQHWVSEIVLPIAFQWIEEHKPAVYANIPKSLSEDVGVVISAAFELVQQEPSYKEGTEKSKGFQRERENGTLDTSKFNPVWTAIAKQVHYEIERAFADRKDVLKYPFFE